MQTEQFNELIQVVYALRDGMEIQGAKLDAQGAKLDALTNEVVSLREDVNDIKSRVTVIEQTMVTKDELQAAKDELRAELRDTETRLMNEIVPIKETVAYLVQQSATHDRDIHAMKQRFAR